VSKFSTESVGCRGDLGDNSIHATRWAKTPRHCINRVDVRRRDYKLDNMLALHYVIHAIAANALCAPDLTSVKTADMWYRFRPGYFMSAPRILSFKALSTLATIVAENGKICRRMRWKQRL